MRTISQEAVKVAGQVLSMAGDVGAARRVVVEAAGWLCDVEGVKLVDDAATVPVVADVFGDVDWAATAREAGWLDATAAAELLEEVEAARAAAAAGDQGEVQRLVRLNVEALDRCDQLTSECNKFSAAASEYFADAAAARAELAAEKKLTADLEEEVSNLIARRERLIAEVKDLRAKLGGAAPAKVDQVVSMPGTPGQLVSAPAKSVAAPAPAAPAELVRPDAVSEAAWASMTPALRKFAVARAAAAAAR